MSKWIYHIETGEYQNSETGQWIDENDLIFIEEEEELEIDRRLEEQRQREEDLGR